MALLVGQADFRKKVKHIYTYKISDGEHTMKEIIINPCSGTAIDAAPSFFVYLAKKSSIFLVFLPFVKRCEKMV